MPEDTLATVVTLLESVLAETDDSEARYKLRTALQLLAAQKEDLHRLETAAAESDGDLETRLRDLGYIE